MPELVISNAPMNFFDNILLLSLNEKAYQNGLIDEDAREKIKREIQAQETERSLPIQ